MKLEHRRGIGIATGLSFGAVMVTCLGASGSEQFHAKGPMNSGHADLGCESCHVDAAGTPRQQLQNAARDWLGLEAVAVDVGFRAVDNAACNTCHEQKDDRHPSFRFLEPRFLEVRAAIHPETCTSCHDEHTGKRVTIAETTYCRNCHADTVLEKDPLDVSHRTLIADGRWDTCLGCHDYHGNHTFEPPRRVKDVIPTIVIERYFEGGVSPYPPPRNRARQPEVP